MVSLVQSVHLIGFVGLVEPVHLIGFVGLVESVHLIGFVGLVESVDLIVFSFVELVDSIVFFLDLLPPFFAWISTYIFHYFTALAFVFV